MAAPRVGGKPAVVGALGEGEEEEEEEVGRTGSLRSVGRGGGRTIVGGCTAPEPPLPGNPLFAAPNLILTPHIGGAAREAMDRTARAVAEAVLDVLSSAETVRHVPRPR